ncbi:MAG: MBOAT family protein [Magnetococcales bacterium]|nr:MBOAT family protein [Magnetococcales bacterium]MBF0156120.1 MBOAT family protein [Magnetococcales bacterium]
MLFNSYPFIMNFLPIALIGFLWIGSCGHHRMAMLWLVLASSFFYGWWNYKYLPLIFGSIIFNYAIGRILIVEGMPASRRLAAMQFGVVVNVLLLGFYKYSNFIVDNVVDLVGVDVNFEQVILPLAISFFTIQQIGFVVDTYRDRIGSRSLLKYGLFVLFFPHLIAGPIIHHKEMLPRLENPRIFRFDSRRLAIGLTVFAIGLAKKVLIADRTLRYVSPAYYAVDSGVTLTFFEAWSASLGYTFQLYFDFSGYSDMATGLAYLFGIRMPANFNSPYKAVSIIDFWRRWHITLSRFLRGYLYVPLGGNRKGAGRRHANLMITMLIGGLWHGAGWNFLLWGGLHGGFLIINHGWRRWTGPSQGTGGRLGNWLGWLLTFLAVVFAWVPFRAKSLEGAVSVWESMLGFHGLSLPPWGALATWGDPIQIPAYDPYLFIPWCLLLFVLTLYFPNTQQWMGRYNPAWRGEGALGASVVHPLRMGLRTTAAEAVVILGLLVLSLAQLEQATEFLYFQF